MTSNPPREPAGDTVPVAHAMGRLERLADALDVLVALPVERLDERGLRVELRTIEVARRRLEARAARAASALTRHHTRAVEEATDPRERREAQREARERHEQLMDELDWTPTEVKDAERLGRQLQRRGPLAAATEAGQIPPKNAKTLGRLLSRLDPDTRDEAEARLLEAARSQTPGVFQESCRRVLAELDPDEAAEAEARRHGRRTASVTDTADGMKRLYAELCGVDGAIVDRAIDAHRRPDAPGEFRRPEQ
ncbi:MAG: DUF222 domain-containing protein, partial [Nitriliruptorales bacterium]|nr:DUF222 domain-containing protein [Nitriliruptorales bacterium]